MINDRAGTLVTDCANCVGLCCVALAFARSEDFAFSKDASEKCRNLTDDFRCRVHSTLRADGLRGCTVFDCHGAGQRVTKTIVADANWRDSAEVGEAMFAVFRVVRQLHEMLWYLASAARAATSPEVCVRIEATYARVDELGGLPGNLLLALDLDELRGAVNPLLQAVSDSVSTEAVRLRKTSLPMTIHSGADLVGADLVGAVLTGHDLRGADLRGALLIAADLVDADLRGCDLLAADLRNTNLCDADLSTTLFVTQMQLNAARGNGATQLPTGTLRPAHLGLARRRCRCLCPAQDVADSPADRAPDNQDRDRLTAAHANQYGIAESLHQCKRCAIDDGGLRHVTAVLNLLNERGIARERGG